MRKHLLVILDGYGIAEDPSVSAIERARKPFLDKMFAMWPHGRLQASGRAVGLPEGQMGNSEVGHMNLGAGRVVYQDITRIDVAIEDGSFYANEVLVRVVREAKAAGRRLHLLGLLSDGGVHSHRNHVAALLELCAREGMASDRVCVHAFMDGRDTDPHSGAGHVAWLLDAMERTGAGRLATVVGRYFAMDRDNRWERVEKAWRALVEGDGTPVPDQRSAWLDAIQAQYNAGTTDEFLEPLVADGTPAPGRVSDGDAVIVFNFRSDRARQLTRALTDPEFDAFPVTRLDLDYVTFAKYDNSFTFPVAFPKVNLTHTIGEAVASAGLRQLRAAETEKYPHVTYFFNGGREEAFPGEDRIMIPSPKVATYDLQPEMSAPELGHRVAEAIRTNDYALVVINFANPDMVGHTGDFDAAVKAVEAVDAAAGEVVTAAMQSGYSVSIIADHGNCDRMRNPDGSPHTAHTTVPVPHLIALEGFTGPIREGRLGDVAPTILAILGLDQPAEMTGEILIDIPGAEMTVS